MHCVKLESNTVICIHPIYTYSPVSTSVYALSAPNHCVEAGVQSGETECVFDRGIT